MNDLRVVNRNVHPRCADGSVRVYVGRPSILGNPFKIGRDGTRAEVIAAYRRWLWQAIRSRDAAVVGELDRIAAIAQAQPVELACYCHPLPCHASVIAAALARWREIRPD